MGSIGEKVGERLNVNGIPDTWGYAILLARINDFFAIIVE